MTRWDEIKVHVAGVPLSSVEDCRLVVGPFGCDDVVVVGGVERRHNLCFFQFERVCDRTKVYGTSSPVEARSPCSCGGSGRRRES